MLHNILKGNFLTNGFDKEKLYKYKTEIHELISSKHKILFKRKLLSQNLLLVKIIISILFKNKVLDYEFSKELRI